MRITGKAKTCVWRWQERFMVAGADGLLRDKALGKTRSIAGNGEPQSRHTRFQRSGVCR